MPTLPAEYLNILKSFVPLFSRSVWRHAQVLLLGAILAPGKRTVSAVLRIVGLSNTRQFQRYHRVLNRAVWSSWAVSQALLALLVKTFAARGPVVLGIDDTIERRRGAHIRARGIYRDPVRSSHGHMVKASGLRWLSVMLLVPIPWAKRVWALPFLTCLAPSERFYEKSLRMPKKLTDWARQALLQVRRWLPKRKLVVLADSGFAVLALLWRMSQLSNPICMITRLRLDAALYKPAPKRKPHQRGRSRVKGARLPTLQQVLDKTKTKWQKITLLDWYGQACRTVEIHSGTAVWYHSGLPVLPIRWLLIRDPKGKFKPQALLCTDPSVTPAQMLKWFAWRWQLEVTFREVREHLGVETQRQWSDHAIIRTTPALLGLFALVTLLAHQHVQRNQLPIRQTAWYAKSSATFSDALAVVRQHVWCHWIFLPSTSATTRRNFSPDFQRYFIDALSYAN